MIRTILLITFAVFSLQQTLNNQPVIGVFTQPSSYSAYGYPSSEYSYIAGSYIHHLESSGAQVIPIQWDLPQSQLQSLFSQVNGILFPGGATNIGKGTTPSTWGAAGGYLLSLMMQANSQGDFFPIWSTCLGYELMVETFAHNFSLLITIPTALGDDTNKDIFLTTAGLSSEMFANMDADLLAALPVEKLAYFHHSYTPDPQAWISNIFLANNFSVTTITNNTGTKTYAASVGGKIFPAFGSQFHPEKNTFEWRVNTSIPHSPDAIRFQQYFANFFVNQTRKSGHSMSQENIMQYSIWNYNPIHVNVDPQFEEIYFFKNYQINTEDFEDVEESHETFLADQ
jgi:gamma-glutamyl hydrolase